MYNITITSCFQKPSEGNLSVLHFVVVYLLKLSRRFDKHSKELLLIIISRKYENISLVFFIIYFKPG